MGSVEELIAAIERIDRSTTTTIGGGISQPEG